MVHRKIPRDERRIFQRAGSRIFTILFVALHLDTSEKDDSKVTAGKNSALILSASSCDVDLRIDRESRRQEAPRIKVESGAANRRWFKQPHVHILRTVTLLCVNICFFHQQIVRARAYILEQ